jgi:hypothetical protein
MLKVSTIFMMLLAASLIAISSLHSQLEIVFGQGSSAAQPLQRDSQILAQPQQQQQPPTTQSPNQGQMVRQEPGLPAKITQLSQADMLLADRIFPYLIQKMDAKTLQTLIEKVDGKQLASKVLPHIRLRISGAPSYSEPLQVDKNALSPDTYHHVSARCGPGEVMFGGGGHVRDKSMNDWRRSTEDNSLLESGIGNFGNQWKVTAKMSSAGDVYAEAICYKIALEVVP